MHDKDINYSLQGFRLETKSCLRFSFQKDRVFFNNQWRKQRIVSFLYQVLKCPTWRLQLQLQKILQKMLVQGQCAVVSAPSFYSSLKSVCRIYASDVLYSSPYRNDTMTDAGKTLPPFKKIAASLIVAKNNHITGQTLIRLTEGADTAEKRQAICPWDMSQHNVSVLLVSHAPFSVNSTSVRVRVYEKISKKKQEGILPPPFRRVPHGAQWWQQWNILAFAPTSLVMVIHHIPVRFWHLAGEYGRLCIHMMNLCVTQSSIGPFKNLF